MSAMGEPKPPQPPQLVGEVLRIGRLPGEIVKDPSDRF